MHVACCSSRKGTEETAAHLAKGGSRGGGYVRDGLQRNALYAAADRVASKALGQALRSGIGLHHGNLEPQDRAAVEKLFLDRALPVQPPTAGCSAACARPIQALCFWSSFLANGPASFAKILVCSSLCLHS